MESVGLIKEAVLAIDNREDDILEHRTAKTNTEFLVQKVLSAFAFALENAATENYYSNQTDIPPDSRRLLYCLNNCKYTQTKIVPNIVNKLTDLDQLSLDKVGVFSFLCGERKNILTLGKIFQAITESINMYSVLDQKLFDAYNELKCEPIIAIIEPNMYAGKFDWAKCVRPTGARNYVKEIVHQAVCVHAEVSRVGQVSCDWCRAAILVSDWSHIVNTHL